MAHASAAVEVKVSPGEDNPAGFVLVDRQLRPIYVNPEAVKILLYPECPKSTRQMSTLLGEKLRSIFQDLAAAPESKCHTQIVSGRRHYICRYFSLWFSNSLNGNQDAAPARALLIERNRKFSDLSSVAVKFNLTHRELQVAELLAQGLTSKEIANRMQISHNTVKAFLRLVMIKTGASTRSGIVGVLLRG